MLELIHKCRGLQNICKKTNEVINIMTNVKKILGLILAIAGKLGAIGILVAVATMSFVGDTPFANKLNILWFILALVACYFLFSIGDKMIDNSFVSGGLLAVKRRLYAALYFIMTKLLKFLLWICVVCSVCWFWYEVIAIFNTELNYSIVTGVGVTAVLYVAIVVRVEDYLEYHCKHCGANLKGSGYQYEEVERSYRVDSNNKGHLNSKVRFEVECAQCGADNIWYRTMGTNPEAIDNYIRRIVGRN